MITCRLLSHNELRRYEYFLKQRNMDTRSMYFGIPYTDEQITKLVDIMVADPDRHRMIVAENSDLEVVGTIHIATLRPGEVELGVMVAEAYRKQGISSQMMDYAITWCQNRDLRHIYMHCLSYNRPILHLVEKFGLGITKDFGDADARVTLPTMNMFSLGKEAMLRHKNLVQDNLIRFHRMLQV